MNCNYVELKDASGNIIGHAIACGTRPRPKKCQVCGKRDGDKLCDYTLSIAGGVTKTCDRRMCTNCAAHVPGKDEDYCPDHRARAGVATSSLPPASELELVPLRARYAGNCFSETCRARIEVGGGVLVLEEFAKAALR